MADNGISTLANKELRQKAKLALAATNRNASGRYDAYDLAELPAQYKVNAVINNSNSEGLLPGRPWSAGGATLEDLVMFLDPWFATAGTDIYDQSLTGGNHGVLANGTVHDTASEPRAFVLDGVDDYIRSANLYSDIGNPDTFSAGAWVYPTAAGVVLQIAGTPTPAQTYYFSALEFVDSAGSPVPNFGIWNGAGTTKDTGAALSYNNWYHMVIAYNGTVLKGYINGVEVASASVTYDSPHDDLLTAHYLLWGAGSGTNMGSGAYLSGRMGEIRVYDTALDAAEVLANFNTSKSRYGY